MKWSFANVSLLMFGLFGILVVTFFNELTVSNEQDYYTLKDAVEASMIDAVDVTYFRLTGSIKINQEKFVENLTRRFSEVATFGEGNYDLEFYQISESPPKVSVRVVDATNSYNIFGTFGTDPTQINIVNEITAIMDVYEDEATIKNKPIKIFPDDDIELVGGKSDEYPDDKIYKYNDEYYHLDKDESIPSVDDNNCELYSNRIECKDDDGNVVILEKVTDVIESGGHPKDPDTPADSDDDEEIPNDEVTDEKIVVNVVNFKGYKDGSYNITPKYSYYLLYDENIYIPVDSDAEKPKNPSCSKTGQNLMCSYNNKSYEFKKVTSFLSNNSPLRCFRVNSSDKYYLSYADNAANKIVVTYGPFGIIGLKYNNKITNGYCVLSNEQMKGFSSGDAVLVRCSVGASYASDGYMNYYHIGKKDNICND